MCFMLKSGKVLPLNKEMTNSLAKRGKAVFNAFEQFDHQKQLKGQAKIVSDGHESIY